MCYIYSSMGQCTYIQLRLKNKALLVCLHLVAMECRALWVSEREPTSYRVIIMVLALNIQKRLLSMSVCLCMCYIHRGRSRGGMQGRFPHTLPTQKYIRMEVEPCALCVLPRLPRVLYTRMKRSILRVRRSPYHFF